MSCRGRRVRPGPAIGAHRCMYGAERATGRTASLVTRVAAVIPTPGEALCADDKAWRAFEVILDEAAGLVASAVGHTGVPLLRALADSRLGDDPVERLLVERAQDLLGTQRHDRNRR